MSSFGNEKLFQISNFRLHLIETMLITAESLTDLNWCGTYLFRSSPDSASRVLDVKCKL